MTDETNTTVEKHEDIELKECEIKKQTFLRTATEEEKMFSELMCKTAAALEESIRAVGKMYITQSIAELINKLGLDNTVQLSEVLKSANEKKYLFQDNGLLTSIGLNLVATYINKLPLIDKNDNTFLCICGKKHVIHITKRGKRVKCDLFMTEGVYAQSWTRLALLFYSEVLRFILRQHGIKPHVSFIV